MFQRQNTASSCFSPRFQSDLITEALSSGKVRIIEHKKTKVQYALKYINKQACAQQGLANNMLRERKLLEECASPFVCNLRYAFQDDVHILMVLDLKLGGDLEFHLRTNGFFTEERTKFYFAEISCGLSYLHSLKIVHRDLKPGNVLLDEFGHASLTDFNIACHYDESKGMTSRSGTLSYMGNHSCFNWALTDNHTIFKTSPGSNKQNQLFKLN
ncbi:kinase-like domain-containing protein [Obelidium mucronatum]|nr:kinase-like domain-containing protein [Obelidium mucronatum]